MFQKISDPAGPYGLNRSPPHHFLLRLRDFPPNLQDVLIIASTASTDIGLFSRSKVPLSGDKPADKISGVFTMTEMSDDSRRAQLPMTGDLGDTSPIGLALDLSSTENVAKPIPSDEMDESPTPLPALMLLNNEGVLASWWIVYSDSIRQNTIYPGLVSAGGASQAQQSSPAPTQTSTSLFGGSSKPTFGLPTFGAPNTVSAFGSARPATAFGAPSLPGSSTTGTFGAPSSLGKSRSQWGAPSTSTTAPSLNAAFGSFGSTPATGTTPAFGAPAFGATSSALSFGSSGLPGSRPSPWGTAGSIATTSAFGQAGGLGKPTSVFGTLTPSAGAVAPSSGGFASFASKGGFAAAAPAPKATGSIFGPKSASGSFATPSPSPGGNTSSPFSNTSNNTGSKTSNLFGSNNFVLGSTFKADNSTENDDLEPSNGAKSSFFGGTFGNALGETAKQTAIEMPQSNEADMDTTEEDTKPEEPLKPDSTTPASTPAALKNQFLKSTAPTSRLFGTTSPTSSDSAVKPAFSAGFGFGKPAEQRRSEGFSFGGLNKTVTPGPATSTSPATQPSAASPNPVPPKIKEEPASDGEVGALGDKVPEAPLPPDTTSKTSFAAGESSVSSAGTDAPLPPDFIPKAAPKPTQPSQLANASLESPIPRDLIPPNDVPGGPEDEGDNSKFSTDDEDEDDNHHREEGSEEGSGEDIAKDLSPISGTNQTAEFTPQSSFRGLNNRSPESSVFTKIQKSGLLNPQRSVYGEIDRSVPVLPPPKVQTSPRSPSPVRSALPGRLWRPDASRSVSAPGAASQLLASQRLPGRVAGPSQSTFALSLEQQKAEEKRRAELRARKEAEETQALVDDDDIMMQKYLSSDLKATRTLDEFVAHSDYVGQTSVDSIPAQVETVYRDINSMIDTLGLNARALKCFIMGHTEQYKEEGRTRDDLEDDEDWCLVEIDNLSAVVEKDLARELKNGRVKDVAAKLETCDDLQKDLIRLRAKHDDIKKILVSHSDPSHIAIARAQSLSAEQAAQQHDLRRDFTRFQKLLSEAEEGLTILKAKIVSQATSNGKSNGSGGPTVEAVMRTISKMTSMAEKRSGDIDVLEGQMRKLRFSSTARGGSREGSPFATPQNSRASLCTPGTSSAYALYYTPESIKDNSRGFQGSLVSSTGSYSRSSPPRKKLSGFTAEQKTQLRTKLARKKEVTGRLRAALQKAGTNVRLMDDNE
jgi:nucleoporin NUP159